MPPEALAERPLSGVCSALCEHLLSEVREVVTHTIGDHRLRPPCLSLLLVGRHPAAVCYAESTMTAAKAAGVTLRVQQLAEATPHAEVLATLRALNADGEVHGIVLQLPLPAHLDAAALLNAVADDKDVDCLKESSVRRCLLLSEPTVSPCIAAACEEILRSLDTIRTARHRGAQPRGPQVLLLGVPPLLALPLELCLQAAGCGVSALSDAAETAAARTALQGADVLLIGARRPDLVAAQWVKSGCVLLDLGLASCSAPALPTPLAPAPSEPLSEPRDVLCLCCSDGLSAMTATLRMRNASHAALLQQGFLEQTHEGLPSAAAAAKLPSHPPTPPLAPAPQQFHPHAHPPPVLPLDECAGMVIDHNLETVLTSV